jgi:hypothetical protein
MWSFWLQPCNQQFELTNAWLTQTICQHHSMPIYLFIYFYGATLLMLILCKKFSGNTYQHKILLYPRKRVIAGEPRINTKFSNQVRLSLFLLKGIITFRKGHVSWMVLNPHHNSNMTNPSLLKALESSRIETSLGWLVYPNDPSIIR